MKLFLVVFPHIVQFSFEAKYKPGLKLILDIDPQLPTAEPYRVHQLFIEIMLFVEIHEINLGSDRNSFMTFRPGRMSEPKKIF
jgi:hypothetical protein